MSLFLLKAHQVASHKQKLKCCSHNPPILPPWLGIACEQQGSKSFDQNQDEG
jgi:hypothetical protein